jgi:hypothetical protein
VLFPEFQNRLQPDIAVEVPVQVNQRQMGINHYDAHGIWLHIG